MGKQNKRPKVSTVMDKDLKYLTNEPPIFSTGDNNKSGRLIFQSRSNGMGHNYLGNFNEGNTLDYNDYTFKNKLVDKFKN